MTLELFFGEREREKSHGFESLHEGRIILFIGETPCYRTIMWQKKMFLSLGISAANNNPTSI
jgi:hypothetical protein